MEGKWIKCWKKLPERTIEVFVHLENGHVDTGYWCFGQDEGQEYWMVGDLTLEMWQVEHWMPIKFPEPPKGEDEKEGDPLDYTRGDSEE